jgi:drug/metabolite transporter (DMT)-like permease
MLGLLAVQGALGALGMAAITRSVSLADVSAVIPFDFLRLPLVAVGAFYLFGQSADAGTWIGAAVIFLGGIIASRRPTPRPATVAAATDIDELDFVQDTTDAKTGKLPATRVDEN